MPSNGSNIAHFACQCNTFRSFRGSLSSLLSDPLSTIPLLHLVNSNVTIFVELTGCIRLKLSLDVTELLFQRATSSTNIDFVLKVYSTNSNECILFGLSNENRLRIHLHTYVFPFKLKVYLLVQVSLLPKVYANTDDT